MRSDLFKRMLEDSGKARMGAFAHSFKDTLMSTYCMPDLELGEDGL